jgi:hypothetical protein
VPSAYCLVPTARFQEQQVRKLTNSRCAVLQWTSGGEEWKMPDAQTLRRCPMAGGGRSAPVSVWLSASCAGAERLLSGRRRLLSGERRLLFGGRRPAGLRLRAGEGARARERRPGGVDEMCCLLRVVRVRGLGQPFHGPTGRYGPICCETFQPTYRVFFFF